MSWAEILAELRSKPTVSVPTAGKALGDLNKNSSYEAAKTGNIGGVPVMEVGGKKRVASIHVLRALDSMAVTRRTNEPTRSRFRPPRSVRTAGRVRPSAPPLNL